MQVYEIIRTNYMLLWLRIKQILTDLFFILLID
jgi:hypothetical protein